jgi:N-acetylglucosaminyl-diphospho-decaprenol L-rhamnosyltransferase
MLDKENISVSIVSHNNWKEIEKLLNKIIKISLIKEILITINKPEVINLDNLFHNKVQLHHNDKELSYSKNQNNAFNRAVNKYFIMINPDIIFEQNDMESFICQSLKIFRKENTLISPILFDIKGQVSNPPRKFIKITMLPRLFIKKFFSLEDHFFQVHNLSREHWISGGIYFLKSETFKNVGGFDEIYRLYCEDMDFCYRCHINNVKIIQLEAGETNFLHDGRKQSAKKLQFFIWHVHSILKWFYKQTFNPFRK